MAERRRKRVRRVPKNRDGRKRGAAVMFALACNIASPLVPPWWGVALAVIALLLWLYSLAPVEKWTISHIRTNPVSSSISGAILLGIIAIPIIQGWRAWPKTQATPAPQQQTYVPPSNPAPAAPLLQPQEQATPASPSKHKKTPKLSQKSAPDCPPGMPIINATNSVFANAQRDAIHVEGNGCVVSKGSEFIGNKRDAIHIEPAQSNTDTPKQP